MWIIFLTKMSYLAFHIAASELILFIRQNFPRGGGDKKQKMLYFADINFKARICLHYWHLCLFIFKIQDVAKNRFDQFLCRYIRNSIFHWYRYIFAFVAALSFIRYMATLTEIPKLRWIKRKIVYYTILQVTNIPL